MLACYLLGLVDTQTLLDKASNEGVLTLVLLMLVSVGLERLPWLSALSQRMLVPSLGQSLLRLSSITLLFSAFVNNTAVVAALAGTIRKNRRHAASQLLLPLSYAAILGGTLTLIGTSTNLIVSSFLQDVTGRGLGFFTFLPVALPAARDVDAHGDRRARPSTAKERPRSDAPRAIRDGATRTKGRVRGAQATRVAHDDADVRRIRRSDVRGGHVCVGCVGFVNNRRRLRYLRARGRVRVARGDRASDATPGPTPDPGRATDDTSATREARERASWGDSSVGVERPRRFIRHG